MNGQAINWHLVIGLGVPLLCTVLGLLYLAVYLEREK